MNDKKSCNFANSIEMKFSPLSRSDTIKPNIIMPLTMKLLMGSELRNVSPIPEFLSNALDRKSGMGDPSFIFIHCNVEAATEL